jgi:hypothetical protein
MTSPKPEETAKRNTWVGRAVIGLGALVLIVGGVVTVNTSQIEDSRAQLGSKADDAATSVLQLCARNDNVSQVLQKAGVCSKSAEVKQATTPEVLQGAAGERGPSPTDEQVRVQVDSYFSQHPLPPGQLPTAQQVMSAVTAVYNANKPADGPPPTAAVVFQQVAQYCAGDRCRGSDGKNGQDAPAVTAGQLFDQVTAYCNQASKPCVGATGPQGPQGVQGAQGVQGVKGDTGTGVASFAIQGDTTNCFLHIDYDKPRSDGTTSQDIPIPGSFCTPVTPPESSSAAPLSFPR